MAHGESSIDLLLGARTGASGLLKRGTPELPGYRGNHQFQVPFSTGRSALTPYSQDLIATVAHTVRAEPGARVLVVGKADTVGSASQNWSLSRKRAQAVKDSLSQIGLLLRSRKTIVRLENTIR